MKSRFLTCAISFAFLGLGSTPLAARGADAPAPADLIIQNTRVLTVNSNFAVAQAIAVRGDEIVAVGRDRQIERFRGPETRVIDAQGQTVLPGLYDGAVQSYKAAVSELDGPTPTFQSLNDVHDYIVKQAAQKPAGHWIILKDVYPTRLQENRLPTLDELDAAAPQNPLCWDCGSYCLVNSKALEISKITNGTPNPPGGEIVQEFETHKMTGLLRNARSLLNLPPERVASMRQHREALRSLYQLYNEQGITSIAERSAEPEAIDLFRDLSASNELTVRINCSRVIEPSETREESLAALNALTNTAKGHLPCGPTGVGDEWVHIGPLGINVDGELGFGTAYLQTPYGIGPTYQIDEPAYCGVRYPDPDAFRYIYREAAVRGWQLSGRCEGDKSVDGLLNCFKYANFKTNITESHFLITQSALQPPEAWSMCRDLGVGASVEPALLYKDGASLTKTLGEKRLRGFMALKTWFGEGLTAGAGSGHVAGLDSFAGANPWNPWFGMWITMTRQTEQGGYIHPEECITREQAIRMYTYNNAWLGHEESSKGSLEPGKFADLILVDRDLLKCPLDEFKDTKVLLTVVGGKVVWEGNRPAVADSGAGSQVRGPL
jgi:predicted amidohydrolase YtcJ